MKRVVCRLMGMCFLAVSLATFAQSGDTMKQDTMQQGDQMKHDTMKTENMGKMAVSLTGKVSADGKTFVSDKDNKTWTVSNPEALKGHEGHHVIVKAQVNEGKKEIHVASVKTGKDEMKDTMKQDTMKTNEMQH